MKQLKQFFNYYKFSTLKNNINRMGFSMTPKYVATYVLVAAALSFFVGTIVKLNIAFSLIVVLLFILTTPMMLTYKFKFTYEKNRFSDIVDYMQRLIYSYQKSGKLYTALLDVRKTVSPAMKKEIDLMINFIDEGVAKENLYKEALGIIESHYKCSRLNTLHAYIIDAEMHGGEGDETLAILLNDIRDWSIRTLDYKSERRGIKSRVIMSILLGLVTVTASLYMVPAEYTSQMMDTMLYQIGTTVVLMLYILLYTYVTKSLSISYLDAEVDDFDLYNRAMNRVGKYNKKSIIKRGIICIVLACCFSAITYVLHVPAVAIAIFGLFGLIIYQPIMRHKSDKKIIIREINKAFPVWIRNLVLLLQTNNVGMSIQKSLITCPPVMKPHVEKLLSEIDKNPTSSEPFENFCSEYDLPDIKTTTSFLYYLSNFGSDEMLGQLDYIIKQNTYLTISEEKIRNSDSLSMMSVLILAPMIISMLKLMLDMYSLYDVFSQIITNSGF